MDLLSAAGRWVGFFNLSAMSWLSPNCLVVLEAPENEDHVRQFRTDQCQSSYLCPERLKTMALGVRLYRNRDQSVVKEINGAVLLFPPCGSVLDQCFVPDETLGKAWQLFSLPSCFPCLGERESSITSEIVVRLTSSF